MDIKKSIINLNTILTEFFDKKEEAFNQAASIFLRTVSSNNKILVFGNGGSAAQAQHFAAEFIGKFRNIRSALPALALTTDSSTLTAISNDFSFEDIFLRQVEAFWKKGDVILGLSTSGNSLNVVKVFEKARDLGLLSIALTGEKGGKLASLADILLDVPSCDPPRIQEVHLFLLHMFAEFVDGHI